MKQLHALLALVLAACSSPTAANKIATLPDQLSQGLACLQYEPTVVTLTGMITRHMEYGAPNFGEDPAHDDKEVYWYLDLDQPICVDGKDEDSPDMEGAKDQRRLQIVYHRYPNGQGWIGSHVAVTGTPVPRCDDASSHSGLDPGDEDNKDSAS